MSGAKVVVTDYTFPNLQREEAATLAEGGEFKGHQCKSAGEVADALEGAQVAVVQFAKCDAEAIAGLADNAAIIRYGIGFDNIDVEAANARNIPVGYVPDYCIDEVAEHTCASVLALLRKLSAFDASVRRGEWTAVAIAKPMKAFAETKVGFFGFGQIGHAVHSRLKAFGFSVLVADPAMTAEAAEKLGVELVDADTLFQTSDIVSLHAPATPKTHHFVNAERLKMMQSHAAIVNTARGALIDEAALAAALSAGTISGAALDVFNTEPLEADSPLRDAPGLMLSPHAAWYSETAIGRLQQLVAEDITNHLQGRPLRRPVPGSFANKAGG